MFFIEPGEVNLIDPAALLRKPAVLRAQDSFGALSTLTGARHSKSALAAEKTGVWELRRCDLESLLVKMPVFDSRFRGFVQGGEVARYLQARHMNADQAPRWTRKTLRSLDLGEPLPEAADIKVGIHQNKGAPLAIWLGITLDGIPSHG